MANNLGTATNESRELSRVNTSVILALCADVRIADYRISDKGRDLNGYAEIISSYIGKCTMRMTQESILSSDSLADAGEMV
jgi:hypothetical protein